MGSTSARTLNEEYRDVFAYVGSALMYFQLIELHLSSLVAFSHLEHPVSVETYRRHETKAQGLSYNQLVNVYEKSHFVNTALLIGLRQYGPFRNSLAHRYMIENVQPILSNSESRQKLCTELHSTTEGLKTLLTGVITQRIFLCKKHGFTPRNLEEVASTIMSGNAHIYRAKVSVNSKVSIVSAYLLLGSNKEIPVFETADGALLHLTSDGLQAADVEKDYSLLRVYEPIQRLLPCDVIRRPSRSGPWSYDIRLGSATLQVRPEGSRSFTWSLIPA